MKPLLSSMDLIVCLLLFLAAPVFALNPTTDQWLPLPKFSGGINIMSDRSQLPEGQLLSATNFIWRNEQLEGREGFYRYAAPLSANGVKFIDIFSKPQSSSYLMYSDGVSLWYKPDISGVGIALEFGRSNRGIVDTYGTSIQGDSIAVQKWRTIFGTGEGLTITINSVDYTVDKILLDTLLLVTATAGTTTDQSYNIDYAAININAAITVSDNYWIYSNAGKFYFNRPDSFVTIDSLTGLRYSYSSVTRKCAVSPTLSFAASGVTTNYAGQFLRITTNPFSAGGASNPVTGGHPYYMSYPIRTSGSNKVSTYSAAFQPDSTAAQYFTIEELAYDSTTKTTYVLDSVRLFAADSTLLSCSGTETFYVKIYKASFDSTTFITGDWFFTPKYAWSNGTQSYSGGEIFTTAQTAFPIVGGFEGTDGSILVAVPPYIGSRNNWSNFDKTSACSVIVYRMKKDVQGQQVGGYRIATLHKDRVFEVRSSEPDHIYWSEPFDPDNFNAGSVTIIDQQHPITVAAEQFGELVVYTTVGRWKMFPDATGTLFGKQRMDGSRGCVSRGSFLNIDEVHYGLSADGYWQSAGNAPEIISDAVASYFTDSINVSAYDAIRSGFDADNDNIWISFPTGSAVKNSCTLVYHRATKSWWRQSFVAGAYAYNGEVEISDTVRFIAGGKDSSTIYVRGYRKDDGAAITATLQTPYLDFNEPQIGKRFKSFMIGYDAEAASAVSVLGYRDFGLTAFDTTTFTTDTVWKQKWLRVKDARYRGNNLSLGFSITDAGQLRIPRISVQMIPLGEEE